MIARCVAELTSKPKPSLKIESVKNLFCFDIDNGLKNILFRNKTFQDRELCLKKNIVKPHNISTQSDNRFKK